MISSVGRHVKWTPEVLGSLYVDNIDFEGLVFWYNDYEKYIKEMKESFKTK